ncbi:hypothetical protein [Flavobacterium nitrogenifigens]|uniref:Uncharacterized protein n=1 Tax=Flavobacterium nitrogenifigens TaxID=1617283 RepID=A0A521AEV4_9FLAO|nr:hypothetical protein [Flavobacterium nitrogenifigens]KAF2331473.1 hypothetical protein DM397_12105 [Flavobacterium nitrogenifigens]SMO33240.1 hypothetical protein SAMN06265220_10169 [Flavobacterium nitrogenifigens]
MEDENNNNIAERILKFFQNNLSTIVVIPAFIGGLWQAMELMNISLPYLRFFSISQIIPDGLLILMFMLVSLMPMMMNLIQDFWDEKKGKFLFSNITVDVNELKPLVKKHSTTFLVLVFSSFLMVFIVNYFKIVAKDFSILNVYFIISVTILYVIYTLLNDLGKANKLRPVRYIRFYRLLFIFTTLFLASTLFREIHRNFLLTDDLINIEKANLLVKQKFPTATSEILYFNDKYLFYKIKFEKMKIKESSKTLEKIYIVELNEIFKEEEKKKL